MILRWLFWFTVWCMTFGLAEIEVAYDRRDKRSGYKTGTTKFKFHSWPKVLWRWVAHAA